jgi:hypothetical protein
MKLRTHWRLVQDAAWLAGLMLAGIASILIDVNVGFARLVVLILGKWL